LSIIENLLAVQKHDLRIRSLKQELHDIPERKKIEQDRLESHRTEVGEAEELLKARQASIKELELEVDARKEKIAKLRQQQMELKTNKEFKAMEHEIKAVEDEISDLEDNELVLMSDVEQANGELSTKKQALEKEDAEVQRDVASWDERAGQLEKELETVEAERHTAVQLVDDPEVLGRYEQVLTRKDTALVPLVDGICGGCHMKLPPYVLHTAKRQDGGVCCDFCGRLLYCG